MIYLLIADEVGTATLAPISNETEYYMEDKIPWKWVQIDPKCGENVQVFLPHGELADWGTALIATPYSDGWTREIAIRAALYLLRAWDLHDGTYESDRIIAGLYNECFSASDMMAVADVLMNHYPMLVDA